MAVKKWLTEQEPGLAEEIFFGPGPEVDAGGCGTLPAASRSGSR
jgi:hypothetical protein